MRREPAPQRGPDVDLRGVGDRAVPEEPHGEAEHDGGADEEFAITMPASSRLREPKPLRSRAVTGAENGK